MSDGTPPLGYVRTVESWVGDQKVELISDLISVGLQASAEKNRDFKTIPLENGDFRFPLGSIIPDTVVPAEFTVVAAPRDGTLKNLRVVTRAFPFIELVATVMVNGSPTPLLVNIVPRPGIDSVSDSGELSIAVNRWDLIELKLDVKGAEPFPSPVHFYVDFRW